MDNMLSFVNEGDIVEVSYSLFSSYNLNETLEWVHNTAFNSVLMKVDKIKKDSNLVCSPVIPIEGFGESMDIRLNEINPYMRKNDVDQYATKIHSFLKTNSFNRMLCDSFHWYDISTICGQLNIERKIFDCAYYMHRELFEIDVYKKSVRWSGHEYDDNDPKIQLVPPFEYPFKLYHHTDICNAGLIAKSGFIRSMSNQYVHLTSHKDAAQKIFRNKLVSTFEIDIEKILLDRIPIYRGPRKNLYLMNDIDLKYVKEIHNPV